MAEPARGRDVGDHQKVIDDHLEKTEAVLPKVPEISIPDAVGHDCQPQAEDANKDWLGYQRSDRQLPGDSRDRNYQADQDNHFVNRQADKIGNNFRRPDKQNRIHQEEQAEPKTVGWFGGERLDNGMQTVGGNRPVLERDRIVEGRAPGGHRDEWMDADSSGFRP